MTIRALNNSETSLLDKLLASPFVGATELQSQIHLAKVEIIDENGSLRFHLEKAVPATIDRRIPTEGQARDDDGVYIHALLHVVDGVLWELEFFKEDSSFTIRHWSELEWEVFSEL